MDPLVSVIVPNFNHAKFLPKRLSSITAQTYGNRELILLDDASTDESAKILTEFSKQHPCTVLINPANSGSPFIQWNRGAKLAQGDYLWIAESDDYCEPTLLERLVSKAQSGERIGISYARTRRVDESGAPLDLVPPATKRDRDTRWQSDFSSSGKEEIVRSLSFSCSIPNASAVLIRREAFLNCGGAPENMKLAGDWWTWVSILREWNIAYTAEPLSYFRTSTRLGQRSALRHRPEHIQEWIEVVQKIRREFEIPASTCRRGNEYFAQMSLEAMADQLLTHCALYDAGKVLRMAQAFDKFVIPRAIFVAAKKLISFGF